MKPLFNETSFTHHKENNNAELTVIFDTHKKAFDAYINELANNGWETKESYTLGTHSFAALKSNDKGLFLNYFAGTHELYIVEEQSCNYFSFNVPSLPHKVSPQITSLHLEDFGMSYTIRLPDGRFIVFDGGWEFEPDAVRLYEALVSGSQGQRPIIAAWILTHPHSDHFHCFIKFTEMYADMVDVEKVMFNFPERDDFEHYPSLKNDDWRLEQNVSAYVNIPRMYTAIEKLGAEAFTPHTGQIYTIGDAKCEVLSTLDDTIFLTQNINAASVVIRMELCGQVILWTADASFSDAKLCAKYGDYLKSDILQVPHHGFASGTQPALIEGYLAVQPEVCLLPVSDYNAYTCFCTFVKSTEFLMKNWCKELITGERTRTLTLPYHAPFFTKHELEENFRNGRANNGSNTWIFSDLCTSNPEDFKFTVLNPCNTIATVYIEAFFEDSANNLRHIKLTMPNERIKNIDVSNQNDVDGDSEYFNWMSLKQKGFPKDKAFALRFISNTPIVVSNKIHAPSYTR